MMKGESGSCQPSGTIEALWKRKLIALSVALISALSLLSLYPERVSDRASRKDLVFALYYPRYHSNDWRESTTFQMPVLGKYGTDDPVVAATQISWAFSNSIDGFLVSWEGKSSVSDIHLRHGLLSARNVEVLKFIAVYEGTSIAPETRSRTSGPDFSDSAVRARFLKDMSDLSVYFWHESYLFISNRPVVVLRSSRRYRNMPHSFLQSVEAHLGIKIFFVGDEISFFDADHGKESRLTTTCTGCSAVTALDMSVGNISVDNRNPLSYVSEVGVPTYNSWSQLSHVFPLLTSKLGAHGSNVTDFRKQIRLVQSQKFTPISRSVRTILFIQSFNNWHEDTAIEPSKIFGFDYLNALDTSLKEAR